jgi:DNA-directed RNA polymerase subunit RPC12/RpoP
MALFDNLGKKISATTQNVVRGTKDMTEIARLNSLIGDEQKQIAKMYSQIGKLYYEAAQSGGEDPALQDLCQAVTSAKERIEKHNEEIRRIKGIKQCPDCGAELPRASVFCGTCGAKTEVESKPEKPQPKEDVKRFCSNCGAEMTAELAFCTSCGQKKE